jgi:hypothetical protein
VNARSVVAALLSVVVVCACATSGWGPEPSSDDNANTTGPDKSDCIAPPCADDDSECVDADGDGFGENCSRGVDCNDADETMSPERAERCDGKDNDCNGLVDDRPDCDGSSPCVDQDGDTYGEGCPAGADCDDTDPDRFEGAPEACDGKDNDCDDEVDEDFDLGGDCTNGEGICMADGVTVCMDDGTGIECDARVGTPETEVCDGEDNDCDGEVDDNLDCPDCVEDGYEPNDGSPDATDLTNGSKDGQLCGDGMEADWYYLGEYNAGETVTVRLTFTHAEGDIDLDLYSNFQFDQASASETDDEAIVNHAVSNTGPVHARAYWPPGYTPPDSGTSYTISR